MYVSAGGGGTAHTQGIHKDSIKIQFECLDLFFVTADVVFILQKST